MIAGKGKPGFGGNAKQIKAATRSVDELNPIARCQPPTLPATLRPQQPGGRDGSGSNPSTGAIRRRIALRGHSAARSRALQDAVARCAGLRRRRPARRGDRADRGAGVGLGAGRRNQRDRRRSSVARRRDLAQRLSRHRGHHVRRASRDDDPCHARGHAAGARHCRARRTERPRAADRDRGGMRGDDAGRHRHRLSKIPRPRLARPRHLRSVRRGGGGRVAA